MTVRFPCSLRNEVSRSGRVSRLDRDVGLCGFGRAVVAASVSKAFITELSFTCGTGTEAAAAAAVIAPLAARDTAPAILPVTCPTGLAAVRAQRIAAAAAVTAALLIHDVSAVGADPAVPLAQRGIRRTAVVGLQDPADDAKEFAQVAARQGVADRLLSFSLAQLLVPDVRMMQVGIDR
jgi:hypothetical protein